MSITRDFKLSLVAGRSVPLVINANQYDDGEIWRFTLLDENGQKYSPSTGSIIGLKSDGHIIANAGTVSSTGLVIIPETEQMTAAVGKNFYELLIDDDTHGTANFIVFVEPRPGAGGTPSDSDLAVFQEAIDAAAQIGDASELVDDVAVLKSRMDEFARLPDGSLSTAADAELVDIRVGADGTTYPNAGDAVRGQVGDLHDEVDALTEVVGNKADVNGNYDDLTVGTADQLMADTYTTDAEPYIFRKSGGSADIGNREEDTIVGGTVAWNQLAKFNSSVTYDDIKLTFSSDTGTLTMNGTTTGTYFFILRNGQTLVTPIDGHKYYLFMDNTRTYNFEGFGSTFIGATIRNFTKSSHMPRLHSLASVGEVVNVSCKPQFIDLTQMFGSAVADAVYAMEQANAGSGVRWFKSLFPADYYEYNTGELKSVEGLVSHDMVGFNQWDEEWENGFYSQNGLKSASDEYIRSKNFIPVLPSTVYYFKAYSINGRICFYDSDKNFISRSDTFYNWTFTTPSECHYITFFTKLTTYNPSVQPICINLSWSGTRNGEYEPYVKHSYPLDSTLTLRGIPKIDANGQMYYDGDTYSADGTVTRRYGVVDLGTRNWTLRSGTTDEFTFTLSAKQTGYQNLMCAKYVSVNTSLDDMPEKTIRGHASNGAIYVRDSSYTSASDFKTAMSGVYLVYELATPTTETAEPYTNPQIVSPYGTEEYVTTGITAVGHDTQYPTDLKGKLEALPSIPTAPTANGTYVLKATVTSGGVTYAWVAES